MWGIDDPTAPHAPATNLPDARLNVLHVTIWYVIQLILRTKHTLAFIKKEKTRKKTYLSIQSTHCYSHQCQTVWIQVKTHILSVLTGSKLFALVICRRQKSPRARLSARSDQRLYCRWPVKIVCQTCLHPDQDRQDVGPDRGSNCLPRLSSREPRISS